jgi:hypothetical protein
VLYLHQQNVTKLLITSLYFAAQQQAVSPFFHDTKLMIAVKEIMKLFITWFIKHSTVRVHVFSATFGVSSGK